MFCPNDKLLLIVRGFNDVDEHIFTMNSEDIKKFIYYINSKVVFELPKETSYVNVICRLAIQHSHQMENCFSIFIGKCDIAKKLIYSSDFTNGRVTISDNLAELGSQNIDFAKTRVHYTEDNNGKKKLCHYLAEDDHIMSSLNNLEKYLLQMLENARNAEMSLRRIRTAKPL